MNHARGTCPYILEMSVADDEFSFASSIEAATLSAESELLSLEEIMQSAENLRPDCDKVDYALAASAGALCGLMDIFLVAKPGESPAGYLADEWFLNRTADFAKLYGWDGERPVIQFLEEKFNVPYDQRGAGDAASSVTGVTPTNHHFKSMGHNPTILGLYFSILDQFTNQSHFVSGSELIALQDANGKFQLQGDSVPAKLYCGFSNWLGHLISDVSGSSGSKGRGMGIPSPFWTWTNDIIALKRQLRIPVSQFEDYISELALRLYTKGYDIRFQTAQAIPVIVNELITRLLYAARRLVNYTVTTDQRQRSIQAMWEACEPFSNATVKRMLSVAHGTFCMMDLCDAMMRSSIAGGGAVDATEFLLRLNIIGLGRFTISLYGETKRAVAIKRADSEARFSSREVSIVEDYLKGLSLLSELYDDRDLLRFVGDFTNSDMYVQAFQKSARLAELRKVPDHEILREKADIDQYFRKG